MALLKSSAAGSSSTDTAADSAKTTAAAANATDANALEQIRSLNGHPGCLTESETEALERFRTLLVDAKLYTPASASASCRPSHSEATLWYDLLLDYACHLLTNSLTVDSSEPDDSIPTGR